MSQEQSTAGAGEAARAFLADVQAAAPNLAVLTSEEDRGHYATDQGPITDFQLPDAVLLPESAEDVQAIMRAATQHRIAVIARGAGTGVSGAANATRGSVILSLERMNRILDINAFDETATVEPGVINAELNLAVAEFGLMYAPDPASFAISTIGGNIATNAGGLRCAKYGVTRDSVLALDVVLADGTLLRTGHDTFKGVAGLDLTSLIVGSEGTLGIVVAATVRLKYLPAKTVNLAAFFPDFPSAAAGVQEIGLARVQPAIVELLNHTSMRSLDERFGSALADRGTALLLVQCDGLAADLEAEQVRAAIARAGGTVDDLDPDNATTLINLRRQSRGLDVDQQLRVGEDVAVPRSQLRDYVAALEKIARKHETQLEIVAHAGDGNLHPTFYIETANPTPQERETLLQRLDAALDESIDQALAARGTITGEHGIGQYKLRWLAQEVPPESARLQREIKNLFDPLGILNPGKAML